VRDLPQIFSKGQNRKRRVLGAAPFMAGSGISKLLNEGGQSGMIRLRCEQGIHQHRTLPHRRTKRTGQ